VNKIKDHKYIKLSLSLSLCMACFLPLLIGRRECVPIVFFICLFALLIQRQTIYISSWEIILAIVFCIWFICGTFSIDYTNYLELIYISIIVLSIIMAGQVNGWEDTFLLFAWIVTFLYVITTLMQYISPRLITAFNHVLLNSKNFEANVTFLNKGAYAGITNQTGVNGYFICVFLAITTSKLVFIINSKSKKIVWIVVFYYILLGTGYFSLFLTKKRIFLIAAILYTLLLSIHIRSKRKLHILFFFISGVFIYLVIDQTQVLDKYFGRFLIASTTDFSSGRFDLWKQSIRLFSQKPVFGWGWFSSFRLLNIDGVGEVPHNTFLQILLEVGIIGFFAYLGLLFLYLLELKRAFSRNAVTLGVLCSMCFQVIFITWSLTGNPIWSGYPFYLFLLSYPIIRRAIKN